MTQRQVYEDYERQTGKQHPDYPEEHDLPYLVEYIWEWFSQLSAARGTNGFSLNPITFTELQAWSNMTGIRPAPWEVETIMELDAAYRLAMAEQQIQE